MSSRGGPIAANEPMVLDDEHSEDLDAGDAGDKPQQEEPAAKRKRVMKPRAPRPKVTLDLLKEPKGLMDVFTNFPDAFRKGFKGPGHEVNDLRRLLELYSRWHQRIFPHCSFDQFISKVEHLSSSMLLKKELRELRANLISVLLPLDAALDEPDAANDAWDRPAAGAARDIESPAGSNDQGHAGTSGPLDRPSAPPVPAPEPAHAASRRDRQDQEDDDDDEFEQMQRQAQQANDESQWDIAMDAVGGLHDSDDDWQPPGVPVQQAPAGVSRSRNSQMPTGRTEDAAAGASAAAAADAALEDAMDDEAVFDDSQQGSKGNEDTQTRNGRRARAVLLESSDGDDA